MGNHLSGNGNYLHSHGNLCPKVLCCDEQSKKPRLDDFSDLCDPEDMKRQRNELSYYVNMKVSKDAEIIDFWRENHAVLP